MNENVKYSRNLVLKEGLPFVLTLLVLASYLYIISPTVYWGDSGFLAGSAFSLGIPHPTGHPLFSILGKSASIIPLGSVAFRMNLMSLLFCLLSGVAAFFLLKDLFASVDGKRENPPRLGTFVALVSCVSVSLSSVMLFQAGSVETYSLQLFLMLVCAAFLVRGVRASREMPEKNPDMSFFAGFFLLGLAFGNHSLMTLCLALPYAAVFLRVSRGNFSISMLKAFMFLAIGVSVYIYLPVRASADPFINGGDPRNLGNFFWVVTGGRYSGNIFSLAGTLKNFNLENFLFATGANFETFLENLNPAWICFFAIGLAVFSRERLLLAFFAILLLLNAGITYPWMFYAKAKLSQAGDIGYYLVLVSFGFILGGTGLFWLLSWFKKAKFPVLRLIIPSVILFSLLLLPFLRFFNLRRDFDRSKDYSAYAVSRSMLSSMDHGGLYFALSDTGIFSPLYQQACEDYRSDVTVFISEMFFDKDMLGVLKTRYPGITSSIGGNAHLNRSSFGSYVKSLSDKHGVYVESIEPFSLDVRGFFPQGAVFKAGSRVDIERHFGLSSNLIFEFKTLEPSKRSLARTTHYFTNAGRYFLVRKDYENALREFELLLELDRGNKAAALNVQILLNELKDYGKALERGADFIKRFDNPFIYYNYGLSLLYSGRKKDAKVFLESIEDRFGDHPVYRDMLLKLRGGLN